MIKTLQNLSHAAAACLLALGASALSAQLPNQPVTPESLDPEALADFRAPLHATITTQAINAKPSPKHSFTSGTGHFDDLNAINYFHGGFEPMAFRPKLRAAATHPELVVLEPAHAESVAEGFYDGARVRVYQAINGQLTKIRDARVKLGGHRASGWIPYRGQRNTTAEETTYSIAFDGSFRPDHTYWFVVRAVDAFGRESGNSNPVSARSGSGVSGQAMAQPPAPWTRFADNPPKGSTPPAAPTGLRAESDGQTVTLNWEPVEDANLSGYRIYISGYDPAEHRGYGLELESSDPLPSQPIQARDIVFIDQFKTTLDQEDRAPFATWPATRNKVKSPFDKVHFQTPYGMWSDASDGYPAQWRFVEHPAPVPEAMTGRGETCLHWVSDAETPTGFPLTQYSSPDNSWYPALKAETYTVEAWVRGSGSLQLVFEGPHASPDAALPFGLSSRSKADLAIEPVDLPLTSEWQKVTASFTVPGQFDQGLGSLLLVLQGPGEFYLDNLRIYQADHPFGEYDPLTHQRIREMDIRYMRTHELIKTTWGYTLEGMTNDALANNYAGARLQSQSFFTLLNNLHKAGNISPWLQVEMCLAEEEWQGFAEWLCAPYNPAAGDTPESKPWAYKRWSMGQKEPWIDVFPEFAFEVANETWNRTFAPYDWDWGTPLTDGATGRNYSYGETYGLFNEYVIQQLRKSPYWSDKVEDKMRYMLCGWQAAPAFGAGAVEYSPSADLVSYAAYISTDGLGDMRVADDFKRFYLMQWSISAVAGQSARNEQNEKALRALGREVESGIYEYGMGFGVGPGDPKAKEVDQVLFRSMVAAVATLDAGLTRYQFGMTDQAYFTFGHRIGAWGSHTTLDFGGHAYPYTKAIDLYNEHGTGVFLNTEIQSVPKWDFPAYEAEDNMHKVKRDARPDAPLVSTYASTMGDRLTVFLISRKLDNFPIAGDPGYTPVTLQLPFSNADKLTAYILTGDPRTDDRFEETVHLQSQEISLENFRGILPVNEFTGGSSEGLPPATIMAYVFEGVQMPQITPPPVADFEIPNSAKVGEPVSFRATPQFARSINWSLGSAGASTDATPSVTFTKAGVENLRLTAIGADGRRDVLTRESFPVGFTFGNLSWMPVPAPGRLAGKFSAEVKGSSLIVAGSTPLVSEGPNGAFALDPCYRENFTLQARVASVEGTPAAVSGLLLATNPRNGLGFSLDNYNQIQIPVSLLVQPDGAIVSLNGRGRLTDTLLRPGTLSFPIDLRIEVRGQAARLSAKSGSGGWRELASVDVPLDLGVFPAITASSLQGEAVATYEAVNFTKSR